MSYIQTLPDKLCEWFSDMREFSDCSFCTCFPNDSQAYPLIKPIIVFGLSSVKINSEAENAVNTLTVRTAEEEFFIDINIPRLNSGTACTDILGRVIELLLFGLPVRVMSLNTEKIKYERDTDSLLIHTVFTINEALKNDSSYPSPPVL